MAQPAGGSATEGTKASEGDWEVSDVDLPPTRLHEKQVLGYVCGGRLGFRAQVRRVGESTWTPAMQRPEFGYVFPRLGGLYTDRSVKWMWGMAMVNPNLEAAIYFARGRPSEFETGKARLWFSMHMPSATAPLWRQTGLFRVWDGFYVGPIIESRSVAPEDWLNVYMMAFNLTDRAARAMVYATDTVVTADMQRNLTFALGPGKWTVQRVPIPAKPRPDMYDIGFGSRITGTSGVTGTSMRLLTPGEPAYAPGYNGFILRYEVLDPKVASKVAAWKAYALDVVARRFSEAGATSITVPPGIAVPREEILQRFGMFLAPDAVLAALDREKGTPEENLANLFNGFMVNRYAVSAKDAFPKV